MAKNPNSPTDQAEAQHSSYAPHSHDFSGENLLTPEDPSLLQAADDALHEGRGSSAVRQRGMLQMQRAVGNRATMRHVQRAHVAVQRDATTTAATKGTENFNESTSTFAIEATTLADAAAVMESMGEAADIDWTPRFNLSRGDNGKVTDVTIDVDIQIVLPVWPGAAKLKPKAKAEWDRAYQALVDHEQEHVKLIKRALTGLARQMIGKTEPAANTLFNNAVTTLQQTSKSFDTRTDHGRKTGTTINVDAGKDEEEKKPTQP